MESVVEIEIVGNDDGVFWNDGESTASDVWVFYCHREGAKRLIEREGKWG